MGGAGRSPETIYKVSRISSRAKRDGVFTCGKNCPTFAGIPVERTIDNGRGNLIGNLKRCYETGNDVCTTCYGNYMLMRG